MLISDWKLIDSNADLLNHSGKPTPKINIGNADRIRKGSKKPPIISQQIAIFRPKNPTRKVRQYYQKYDKITL
jgi:hypothetical protein